MTRPPVALTVAGTDSGGGAGIAADLHTFAAHGVWGTCAVTAVTAQNTVGVEAVEVLPPEIVAAQIAAVAGDLVVAAVKTGMLGDAAVVEAVAAAVEEWDLHPLVVDPVSVASTGGALLTGDGVTALRRRLLPLADLVTPNVAEAALLADLDEVPRDEAAVERAAAAVLDLGPRAVLLTGGHLPGPESPDLLMWREEDEHVWTVIGDRPRQVSNRSRRAWLRGRRLEAWATHGTGCVLSAAVTARLARGEDLVQAVEGAKAFVTAAIAAGVELGAGPGAVNPFGSSPP
ncbi:MAG TPA: bifunctional hydroxymethylpyrimidine kinase/phosphomethylpyrimidine kinase [Acidimicrobiia bacterium]|nr:bifunctional hydroxymethylpyrimidine kinase/phosphomethylpyrimidine kinase [Acidimicrobiia bacterium]HKN90408.1 bifunctional hydroxymethylpyrimidine kinase/phosphomethylpyrimidine kinase [Acidimicrobiia bacterium]